MILARNVHPGDRVLILGGAGGVGAHLVQFVKAAGATFIAATTSKADNLLKGLGVNRTIDYTREQWWELSELAASPMDVVFDLASGPDGWMRVCGSKAVKPATMGGRYYTTMPGTARPIVKSTLDVLKILHTLVSHKIYSSVARSSAPSFNMPALLIPAAMAPTTAGGREESNIEALARRFASAEVRAVVDPLGPFPFTVDGIARAFQLQASRHAHGKVVVAVTS